MYIYIYIYIYLVRPWSVRPHTFQPWYATRCPYILNILVHAISLSSRHSPARRSSVATKNILDMPFGQFSSFQIAKFQIERLKS